MVSSSKVMSVAFDHDGWNYMAWGVNVSFEIRISPTFVPRMRRVSFGFYTESGESVKDPASPTNLAILDINSFRTLPWSGFQVNGHKGEEVGFTYIALQ